MKSKERMLIALGGGTPDRLPVSVHQWQKYHLDTYLGGISALDAFRMFGMDASLQYFGEMGQLSQDTGRRYAAGATYVRYDSPEWREDVKVISDDPDDRVYHNTVTTPAGTLTYKTAGNRKTTWITEYLVKQRRRHRADSQVHARAAARPGADRRRLRRDRRPRHPARFRLGRSGRLLAARLLPDGRQRVDPAHASTSRTGCTSSCGILLEKKLRFVEIDAGREVRPDRDRRRRGLVDGHLAEDCTRRSACPTTGRSTMPCTTWRLPDRLPHVRRHAGASRT